MDELPTTKIGRASCKGITYRQLIATDHGYLYSADIKGTIRYEVFRRKIAKATNFFTDTGINIAYPERIQWPGDSHFGKWAWTYTNEEAALDKLGES